MFDQFNSLMIQMIIQLSLKISSNWLRIKKKIFLLNCFDHVQLRNKIERRSMNKRRSFVSQLFQIWKKDNLNSQFDNHHLYSKISTFNNGKEDFSIFWSIW